MDFIMNLLGVSWSYISLLLHSLIAILLMEKENHFLLQILGTILLIETIFNLAIMFT